MDSHGSAEWLVRGVAWASTFRSFATRQHQHARGQSRPQSTKSPAQGRRLPNNDAEPHTKQPVPKSRRSKPRSVFSATHTALLSKAHKATQVALFGERLEACTQFIERATKRLEKSDSMIPMDVGTVVAHDRRSETSIFVWIVRGVLFVEKALDFFEMWSTIWFARIQDLRKRGLRDFSASASQWSQVPIVPVEEGTARMDPTSTVAASQGAIASEVMSRPRESTKLEASGQNHREGPIQRALQEFPSKGMSLRWSTQPVQKPRLISPRDAVRRFWFVCDAFSPVLPPRCFPRGPESVSPSHHERVRTTFSCLLLFRPRRGGKVPRKHWLALSRGIEDSVHQSSVRCRRRQRQDDGVQRRVDRSHSLVRLGELSAVRQALEGANVAPGTLTTFPTPTSARQPVEVFELDGDVLFTCLRTARRGAAPGPSGMTDHLFPIFESETDSELFVQVASKLAIADVPQEVTDGIRLGRLVREGNRATPSCQCHSHWASTLL